MNRKLNIIASIGLAIGALFGTSGSIFTEPILQIVLYQISSIGLTVACAILTIKFLRENNDLIAAGFLLFAIGEAVMTAGAASGSVGGQASFGAGMALYVPALFLISIPKTFPLWTRISGIAATIPFSTAASIIFLGGQALSTSPIPGAGYGLLVITIIGWILTIVRKERITEEHKTGNMAQFSSTKFSK